MQVGKLENVSFCGMAVKIPNKIICNAQDAIEQWEVLKHPKFTNIFQETESVSLDEVKINKDIRNSNYSFLDRLTSEIEKAKFIEYFKRITGFPSLSLVAQKMVEEFHRVLHVASFKMGKRTDDVLLTGYDKFCSVGLGSALPGSDIDKGYAIIKGVFGGMAAQKQHSNLFKGLVWNNIDSRIMSVNHCAAFPNILTDSELYMSLIDIEKHAKNVIGTDKRFFLFTQERLKNANPVSSAKFNIWLADELSTQNQKVEAKNLAYVVETIRDGAIGIMNKEFASNLHSYMQTSPFALCSNVTQGYPMLSKYLQSRDVITKPKLKARLSVEKEFNDWPIVKQYELVKDIIRSMSGDNKNPEFKQLFYSKPDKHRLLINDILKGDVNCYFNFVPGGEYIELTFNTKKALNSYYDFNVYKMD